MTLPRHTIRATLALPRARPCARTRSNQFLPNNNRAITAVARLYVCILTLLSISLKQCLYLGECHYLVIVAARDISIKIPPRNLLYVYRKQSLSNICTTTTKRMSQLSIHMPYSLTVFCRISNHPCPPYGEVRIVKYTTLSSLSSTIASIISMTTLQNNR